MRNTLSLTKKQYFDGVSAADRNTIQLIYDHFFSKIESFVKRNNGSSEDAKDIFQDAIMAIYVKSKAEDLSNLDCSFYTYIYAICKNLWLKKLRRKKYISLESVAELDHGIEEDVVKSIERKERWDLYNTKFKELGMPCQEILKLFFEKNNFDEISKKLGYGSANYAKKKKYLCKQKLFALIKNDNRFKELNER